MTADVKAWSCYGGTTDEIKTQIQDLIDRGGEIITLSMGYGPTPAAGAGLVHGGNAWCAVVVVDVSRLSS